MDFEKFTQNAQNAVVDSQNIAISLGNQSVDADHLHLALLKQKDGLIVKLLKNMKINTDEYIKELESNLDCLPKVSGGSEQIYATRLFNKVLLNAESIASNFKDEYVSVEHIYYAIIEEKGLNSSKLIKKHGITKESFLEALSKIRGNQRVTSQNPEDSYEALEKYGRDLVEMARDGKLDPVIGRDSEIRHAIQILSRRSKNITVLIGEAGVGKTAVVDGLAQ